jgi:hypothetical protein
MGVGGAAGTLAADLNATDSSHIVVVYSYDEPQTNRLNSGLPAAMYRCGASRAVFGSSRFQYRSAYVLIGIPGCGEGNGAEAYQGAVGSDPNAWVDVAFQVQNGNLLGVTANYQPTSIQDFGYMGDLNATNGATIGANLYGSYTQASWDVVMSSAYVRAEHVQQLTANNLTVDAISRTVNGQVSGTQNGSRVEITSNRLSIYNSSNAERVRLSS